MRTYNSERTSTEKLFNNKSDIEAQREAGRQKIADFQSAIQYDREQRKRTGADKTHNDKVDDARSLVEKHKPLQDAEALGWKNIGVLKEPKKK